MEFFEVKDTASAAAQSQSCPQNGCVQAGCSQSGGCTLNGCVQYYPCS